MGLVSLSASGFPIGTVTVPLDSCWSAGLSNACVAYLEASSLLVHVCVLPDSSSSIKVSVLCCCDKAFVFPVAACV